MNLLFALPYTLAIAAASRTPYTIWLLWIASWLPLVVTWAPADHRWVETWWLCLVAPATLFQACSVLEAFYTAAGRFRFTVRTFNALACVALGAMIAVAEWPDGSAVSQMIDFTLIVRTGAAVVLTLGIAFFAAVRDLDLRKPAHRHLLLVCAMCWTFAIPSLLSLNPWNRSVWFATDTFLSWARAIILLGWSVAVPDWPFGEHASRAGMMCLLLFALCALLFARSLS